MRIQGELVTLRCVEAKDVAPIAAMLNDWSVSQWLSVPPFPYSEAHGTQFLETAQAAHRSQFPTLFAVALNGTDDCVGSIDAQLSAADGYGLGYWIGGRYQRNGFAKDALNVLENYLVERLSVRRLYARVDPANVASARLLTQAGFHFETSVTSPIPTRRGTSGLDQYGKVTDRNS